MEPGIVIIGRNEGERLIQCLASVKGYPVVYVDSGSSDNSVQNANIAGAHLVQLDLSIPFTAARARNAGAEALLTHYPDLNYIQFVDGDCEVNSLWLSNAIDTLKQDANIGAICGRRREKKPKTSIYNLMCDIEWDTPIGEAGACGGDAIYRADLFRKLAGFDESFIAGEEPELCFRIRQAGFIILRLDMEMTLHDADIHSFAQWWNRTKRSGYSFALGALKHGKASEEKFYIREAKGIIFWFAIYCTFLFTLLILSATKPLYATYLLLLFLIALLLQSVRIALNNRRQITTFGFTTIFVYSFFLMLGKVPQFFGLLKCLRDRKLGNEPELIEYK